MEGPPISETTPPPDTVSHFVDRVNYLFDHLLENVGDGDLIGIPINNEVNQCDKPIGFSFRRISYRQVSYGACMTNYPCIILDLTPWTADRVSSFCQNACWFSWCWN